MAGPPARARRARGGCSEAAAFSELTGRLRPIGRLGQGVSGLLGLPLATYTAALVANTSIRVWRRARFHLPPLFAATSAATAGALAVATTPERDSAPATYLAAGGALTAAMVLGAAAVVAGRRSRLAGLLGAGLILGGGLAERLAVYRAGRDSARRTLR